MEEFPEFLHHYTSQDAFLKIVQSKKIWATDVLYLNDHAEFTYAVQLASEILEEYSNDDRQKTLKTALEFLRYGPSPMKHRSIYVASFSEEDDLLSQWRAYCPAGSGFSIAFHRDTLQCIGQHSGFRLIRCEYDQNRQKEIINQLFEESFKQPGYQNVLEFFVDGFLEIAPRLKHWTFSEEREWRLVSPLIPLESPQVKYRAGKSMLVPYLSFKITDDKERLIIDHVRLAPTPHPELARQSVHRHLATLHEDEKLATLSYPDFAQPSKIPFRAW